MGEIHFFVQDKKMSGSFLLLVWTQRKKKAGMSRVKSKYNFEKFLLFQRKKIISLCSTSEKKSLVFSYSARHYKNKFKNFTCENSIFRRKQINFNSQKFIFFQLARQIKDYKITCKNIIFQCFTHGKKCFTT